MLSEDTFYHECEQCGTNLYVQLAYGNEEFRCNRCDTEFTPAAFEGLSKLTDRQRKAYVMIELGGCTTYELGENKQQSRDNWWSALREAKRKMNK